MGRRWRRRKKQRGCTLKRNYGRKIMEKKKERRSKRWNRGEIEDRENNQQEKNCRKRSNTGKRTSRTRNGEQGKAKTEKEKEK